jgi:hypothetical protein
MVIPSEHTSPSPRCISEGDLVIVYESFNAIKAVTVEPKGHYQNRFGAFFHKVGCCSTCTHTHPWQQP